MTKSELELAATAAWQRAADLRQLEVKLFTVAYGLDPLGVLSGGSPAARAAWAVVDAAAAESSKAQWVAVAADEAVWAVVPHESPWVLV